MMNRKLCLSAASLAVWTRSESTQRLSLEVGLTAREEQRQNEVQVQSFSKSSQTAKAEAPLNPQLQSVQNGPLKKK